MVIGDMGCKGGPDRNGVVELDIGWSRNIEVKDMQVRWQKLS